MLSFNCIIHPFVLGPAAQFLINKCVIERNLVTRAQMFFHQAIIQQPFLCCNYSILNIFLVYLIPYSCLNPAACEAFNVPDV